MRQIFAFSFGVFLFIMERAAKSGIFEQRGDRMEEQRGLLVVHTGNGKGKTTAALGLALRAWGNGMKILILQFIKGGWKYGELKALAQLAPRLVIEQMGEGFVSKATEAEKEQHKKAAQETLRRAEEEIASGRWDMVILDEINYAVKFGLVPLEAALALAEKKPPRLHLVMTGRDAAPQLIERADLVTEMKEVKHPLKEGIKAQRGIEF